MPYKESHIWLNRRQGASISDLILTQKDKFLLEALQLEGKFEALQLEGKFIALSGWHIRFEKCLVLMNFCEKGTVRTRGVARLYAVSVFIGTKFSVMAGFVCFVLISHGVPVDVSD